MSLPSPRSTISAGIAALAPHVKTGRIRALAMSGAKRSVQMPEVPTVAELGYPGFDVTSWLGFFVPAGTPQPIINTIYETTERLLKLPEVRTPIERTGPEVVYHNAKQVAAQIKSETAVWAELLKRVNLGNLN